jgi:hypothetical protein
MHLIQFMCAKRLVATKILTYRSRDAILKIPVNKTLQGTMLSSNR